MASADWGTVPAWGAVLGAVAAAIAIIVQRHNSRLLGRIERTVAVHRDLTTGEVGAARDRFTELMWRTGVRVEPGRCHQPEFAELLEPEFTPASSSAARGALARYPDDVATAGTSPSRDLYKVLWCFERIDALRTHGELHEALALALLGDHAVWWNALCVRITDEDTMHRSALERVADWMIERDRSCPSRRPKGLGLSGPAREFVE